jgi:hypothetical protein
MRLDLTHDVPLPATGQAKEEPALKYDAGKPGLHLLPYPALEEIAKVLDYGATKYHPHNWAKGMSWTRLARAALGHTFRWLWGENLDSETGLSHLAHAGCCVLFLLSFELCGLGTDDRFTLVRK